MLRSASSMANGVLGFLGLVEGDSGLDVGATQEVSDLSATNNNQIDTSVNNVHVAEKQLDGELESLFVSDNWEQTFFRNKI